MRFASKRRMRSWTREKGSPRDVQTQARTETPHSTDTHATMYSDYKHYDSMKFLAGCDPIGCTFDGSLPKDAHGGSLSDPVETEKTGILDCIPYGFLVEVDKGFLIDNLCAELGVGCVRPTKKFKNQTLQSAEDTALHQKVGNSRIVIEQVNGGAKGQGRYFNGVIPAKRK